MASVSLLYLSSVERQKANSILLSVALVDSLDEGKR